MNLATRQFCVVAELEVSAEKLFELLTTADGMQRWVPLCRSVRYERLSSTGAIVAGAVRYVRLRGGLTAVERIDACEPPRRVIYELVSAGVRIDRLIRNYRGVMTVSAIGEHRARLEWCGHFDEHPVRALTPIFRASLRALIAHMTANVCRVAGGRIVGSS